MLRRILLICILATVACVAIAAGQEPVTSPQPQLLPPVQSEEDPTNPLLFSLRNEYRNLKNDAWANTFLARFDKLWLRRLGNKHGARGLVLRFDMPLNVVHNGSVTKAGLGDLYAQAIYVPYVARNRKFAFSAGSGIVMPTATDRLLGQGKVILSPVVVPIWYFKNRKRMLLIRAQNYVSVAGKRDRANVNYLVVDPVFLLRLRRNTWLITNTEFKWDWRTHQASGITGFQLGRITKGKRAVWIKPEIPWGPGRQSDFIIKIGIHKFR